jgi:hypothetical protein
VKRYPELSGYLFDLLLLPRRLNQVDCRSGILASGSFFRRAFPSPQRTESVALLNSRVLVVGFAISLQKLSSLPARDFQKKAAVVTGYSGASAADFHGLP